MRRHSGMRKMRMRGGSVSSGLKSWAKKALGVVRKYGPALARKTKVGSRSLSAISKANPKYSQYIDPVNNYVKQAGYGMCMKHGKGLRSAGNGLRSAGGARRRRRKMR